VFREGRIWLETVAALVVCIFVLMVIHPAVDHAVEQMPITTPALEIPDGLRAAALPVGAILMLLAAVSRMAAMTTMRLLLSALAVVAVIAALWPSRPCWPWAITT
jgi:TRAP-type C4-dicarboxylate transport system permease small subunit